MEVSEKKKFIQQIKMLPTIPFVFHRIIECTEDPNSSAADLKETILNDQSISAKVLSLANSAFYGYPKKVTDITRGIVILGFDTVVDVAISVSILKIFSGKSTEEFDKDNFWLHALASGEAARLLSKMIGGKELELSFITGLLHDIGKVILSNFFPEDYDTAVFNSKASGNDLHVSEKKLFGFDHTDAGSWLGLKWKLPNKIIHPIQFHHNLGNIPVEHTSEIFLAEFGNFLAKKNNLGNSGYDSKAFLHPRIVSEFKLSSRKIDELSEKLVSKKGEMEAFMEVMT